MTLPEFQRADSEQLLIKGGAAKEPSEARWKEPEKLIKKITWDQIREV